MPAERLEVAVSVKCVNIEILLPVGQYVFLKPVFIVVRIRMSESAGEKLCFGRPFFLFFPGCFQQLNVFRGTEFAETCEIRLIPDFPIADFISIFFEKKAYVFAPFIQLRHTVRCILSCPYRGVGKDRHYFHSTLFILIYNSIQKGEMP